MQPLRKENGMRELDREQIIKALECCKFRHIKKNCDECKYHRWMEPSCRDLMCQDAQGLGGGANGYS
jgi:hypothetical protein